MTTYPVPAGWRVLATSLQRRPRARSTNRWSAFTNEELWALRLALQVDAQDNSTHLQMVKNFLWDDIGDEGERRGLWEQAR